MFSESSINCIRNSHLCCGGKNDLFKTESRTARSIPEMLTAVFFFMKSLIELNLNSNFLITTDKWFFAPDGYSYRAVWGKVTIHSDEETLGIKTNDKSSNWYILVGDEKKRVVVAGCQIHYACTCEEPPFTGVLEDTYISAEMAKGYVGQTRSVIYLAQ